MLFLNGIVSIGIHLLASVLLFGCPQTILDFFVFYSELISAPNVFHIFIVSQRGQYKFIEQDDDNLILYLTFLLIIRT